MYRTEAENVSDEQIQSQIDVLNRDFRARNEDRAQVPQWLPDSFIKKDGAPDVEFDG